MAKTKPLNPDEVRMSFGDHLEELRRRILWAIIGLVVATLVCLKFGDHIIAVLTTPYFVAMSELGFDPRLVQLNPTEAFIEYFTICLQFGLVISAPWALYQIWQFVAVGLYPSERRIVRMIAPTSIVLFLVGASFMVTVVLLGLMKFLISVSMWFPLPSAEGNWLWRLLSKQLPVATQSATEPANPPVMIDVRDIDPEKPADGQAWINRRTGELNVYFDGDRHTARLQRARQQQFVTPLMSVSQYLGFVVNLCLAFGLGFQIPIVVVFLIAVQIATAQGLAASRKYVILAVFVLAAILTPTPDIGTMLLLAVPMIVLYEIGLLVGRMIERRRESPNPA
jgi:sec-independent protein translocase protein TatC